MSYEGLLRLIEEMPAWQEMVEELGGDSPLVSASAPEAAKPYTLAALLGRLKRPAIIVSPHPEGSKRLAEQLLTWQPEMEVFLFPEPDSLPYERVSHDTTSETDRIQALAALADTALNRNRAPVVFAPAAALMQKVPPKGEFTGGTCTITRGMEIEPQKLMERLRQTGYEFEPVVEIPGTVSRRGGIIDIFPPTSDLPARIEFFGNTIDTIRLFDPEDQRSLRTVTSFSVSPAVELLGPSDPSRRAEVRAAFEKISLDKLNDDARGEFQRDIDAMLNNEKSGSLKFYAPLFHQESLLSYLPDHGLLILDDPDLIRIAIEDLGMQGEESRIEKIELGELPGDFPVPYFTREELDSGFASKRRLVLYSPGYPGKEKRHELGFSSAPAYTGQVPEFIDKARQMLFQGKRIIIVSHQAERLAELFEEADVIAAPLSGVEDVPAAGSLTLVQGLMAGGWSMNGNVSLFTDNEIFGFIKQRRMMKKRPVPRQRLYVDINPGDFVVHIDHGIARFAGVITMKAYSGEGEKEYLVLEYSSGDKLYVPSDQIDRTTRYVGSGDRTPVLSRLGTQEWSRTKKKVKDAVDDIAEDLVALYANREVVPGYSFSPDTVWQHEVEASFPYVETPDQLDVQKKIKADMEAAKPMDRLVCGDVGYGKTEVAIRAAFKAVMDGKQVAVLVPTTVLAEQHYTAFTERLGAFPVKIEVLSRFRDKAAQKGIVEALAKGEVDICVGTHRMIQKDVSFKELGLLIIDEEQRFGVDHKEFLKKKREEVDVLTLSATPIPRTLHMSLVGVRDMSVMETPPEERLPIKTYVSEFSEHIIREAVLREMERDGQVFFVHNRVQTIELAAEKIRAIVPEARITIGHGQMKEGALEKVIGSFVRGEADILVCSSIIQSGIDMPNVNTLIINQADKFGLTQLHQLRGRVGRGANLAYAYFLYDRGKRLKPLAERRLRTIVEANELGAGFNIAMKDLEIRGAGTLLGMRQSGHISTVGFNLYCQLLARAVEERKAINAGAKKEELTSSHLPAPTIDLPFPAFIPADYITDLLSRLGLYHKLSVLTSIEEIVPAAQEFIDRFGPLPPEVENLLYAIRIKIMATGTGIESISTLHGDVVISLFEGMRFDRYRLDKLERRGVKTNVFQIRLDLARLGDDWKTVLEEVLTGIA